MPNEDLGYRLEITLRSLASTRHTDGSLSLDSADARDLLELLEGSARAIREFGNLRRRLLEVINDPSHRSVTVPLREVAGLLRLDWIAVGRHHRPSAADSARSSPTLAIVATSSVAPAFDTTPVPAVSTFNDGYNPVGFLTRKVLQNLYGYGPQ